MSVFSSKRIVFAVLATALLASSAFAVNPSPRSHSRMAWDADAGELILFGGASAFDVGTSQAYDSNETWAWTGARWVQRYPAHVPPARTGHHMAYDSTRGRIVMFGGRQTVGTPNGAIRTLNDTWVYDNGDWSEVVTPNAPPARQLGAMAYDPLRDRVVLYGGTSVAANGLDATLVSDTWEFDGTTWTKVGDEAVKFGRPTMVYDAARAQMIMLASDAEIKPRQYRLDTITKTWVELKPAALPACANDAALVYQEHNRRILLAGGICTAADGFLDKNWEWDGTTWTELKTATSIARVTALALAYDPLRQTTVHYGGIDALDTLPRSDTIILRNGNWGVTSLLTRPGPRSLFAFTSDPINQTIWLTGGVSEFNSNYLSDFWGYRGGQFFTKVMKDPPPSCDAPASAFDTTRNKMIVVCWVTTGLDMEVFEFDGATFKQMTTDKDKPDARRFATVVYDESLKKIVMFGGFDTEANFKDETWTWDGTSWTEVKKDKPENRGLHAMWYDPLQKKTIIYGGIGRDSIEDHVERFSDMWAFSGTGWTKLSVTNTPGRRLGAQYAVDPATGKLLLFGGLKVEQSDPNNENTQRQFYDNETWQWDGAASTWTKLSPATVPAPRQNGRLAYDPITKRLTMFGGFNGFFSSEIWSWTGSNWEVHGETAGGRRRAAGGVVSAPAPSTIEE